MAAQTDFVMETPVGRVRLITDDQQLLNLEYATRRPVTKGRLSPTAQQVKDQIQRYFDSAHSPFNIKFVLQGTAFQQRVWQALLAIPVGQTKTYGDVAKQLNSSARAVGNACRVNPIPLVVPCHRVVAKNGIGGFSGETDGSCIRRKRWLLQHEGVML